MELEFHVKIFILLDFYKIEFRNKGILLYIFWTKWANTHFGRGINIIEVDDFTRS